MAFSAFLLEGLALPLTITGLSMKWRDGVLLVWPTCCALALMYLFSMESDAYDNSTEGILIIKIASKPFNLKAAQPCSTAGLVDILVKYDEQKQEIQSLKAEGLNSSYRLLQCKTMFIRELAQESEATKD